jgi:hypothetical protein
VRVVKIIFFLGLAVIIVAVGMLAWLYLPSPRQQSSHSFTLEPLAPDGGESSPGEWSMKVDSPRTIHLGDSGTLRLTVSADPSTSLGAGPIAFPPNPTADAPSNHNVIVEARAEIPAAGASPSGLSSQTLAPGRGARFEWSVTPQSEGMLDGRVWLYLRSLPGDGTEPIRRPLSVQPVTIHSDTFFGRVTDPVRQIAFIALGIGLALALPHLLIRSHARRLRTPAQPPEAKL